MVKNTENTKDTEPKAEKKSFLDWLWDHKWLVLGGVTAIAVGGVITKAVVDACSPSTITLPDLSSGDSGEKTLPAPEKLIGLGVNDIYERTAGYGLMTGFATGGSYPATVGDIDKIKEALLDLPGVDETSEMWMELDVVKNGIETATEE